MQTKNGFKSAIYNLRDVCRYAIAYADSNKRLLGRNGVAGLISVRCLTRETGKYLLAMQRVFHAKSIFTENTNERFLICLDYLLRALCNNPHFDGYTHEKLSSVFRHSKRYLQSIAEQNYLDEKFEWNIREMMSIPLSQFESVIAIPSSEPGLDFHATRLIIALLKHGLKQERSPKQFCELSDAVNIELGDYLLLSLASKLDVLTPDRLDDKPLMILMAYAKMPGMDLIASQNLVCWMELRQC